MKTHLSVFALTAFCVSSLASDARGQAPPAPPAGYFPGAPAGAMPGGPMPGPMGGPIAGPMGGPMAGPMGPMGPVQLAGGVMPMAGQGFAPGCDACDAYGNSIAFGGGGGYEQCGPHYFDVAADALYWRRDQSAEPGFAISQDGSSNVVLSTGDVSFNYEVGYRVVGRYDLGPVSMVEALYFGGYEWGESAEVTGTADLDSFFTDFGTNFTVQPVDNADLHRLTYASELHNAEINYRTYWVGQHPALTGTWLVGARYVRLTEDAGFASRVNGPPSQFLDYNVSTENDLVGFQVGGDAAYCVAQGLRLVAEGKIGIYNNRVKQATNISATGIAPPSIGFAEGNEVAFVSDGSIGFVADILPSWSVEGGYQVMFINSIALAANQMALNSDPTVVFNGNPEIAVTLADQGRALYHGGYLGVQYVW